ncbi:MAG: nuclear transport factor 2 family protein [Myxococcota bacterium]
MADARNAIENLLYQYAERMDAGDFSGVGELFARARLLDPAGGVLATGQDEVQALYERSTKRYADGTPGTQHLTTNMSLSLAEACRTAAARSYFSVMQALPDFQLQCIISGSYHDEFAYDDSKGWCFTQRQMKPKLIGDLSHHLNFELPNS